MLLVVMWRIITHLCFHPREKGSMAVELLPQNDFEAAAGFKPTQVGPGGKTVVIGGTTTRETVIKEEQVQIGWMTEAKDWAGELISGQSMVSRALPKLRSLTSNAIFLKKCILDRQNSSRTGLPPIDRLFGDLLHRYLQVSSDNNMYILPIARLRFQRLLPGGNLHSVVGEVRRPHVR